MRMPGCPGHHSLFQSPVTHLVRTLVVGLVLSSAAVLPGIAEAAVAPETSPPVKVRRGYVDMRYGQLHYLVATPLVPAAQQQRPLVMFHQSPLSAFELEALAAEMGRDRLTIAVDTPGQGYSDGPEQVPTIADYATAIAEGLRGLGFAAGNPVDVLGTHTGAFIATELAIQEPDMVKRMVLSGVYIVPEERRLKAIANLTHATTSAGFFDDLCRIMPVIKSYYSEQGLADSAWGRNIASSLLPLTRREYAHEAAFAYAATAAEQLAKLQQPVLLLAMNDGIGGPTRDSARFIKHTEVRDLPTFKDGAWTTNVNEIAALLREFLR